MLTLPDTVAIPWPTVPGADLGGGCRGCTPPPPLPWDGLQFSNTTGILQKKKNYVVYWCWSRARDKCTPPQKNPGSTPAYRSPNLFWAFLCFGLELSPFFPKISLIHGTWYILHVFCHWQKYLYFVKWILMVCTSCKTSYNVLSHTHAFIWGLGQLCLSGGWGGGVMQKRETLHILDLQRLVSLSLVRDYICIMWHSY